MLLSGWFFALLIGFAIAAIVLLVVEEWTRARRGSARSAWRTWTVRISLPVFFVVFGLAAVADGINRHFAYIPSFSALAGHVSNDLVAGDSPYVTGLSTASDPRLPMPAHGIVLKLKIFGPRSHLHRAAYVYLPREYYDPAQRTRRFPTFYLLHGSPGDAVDWLRGGFADVAMDRLDAAHVITPFIVVLPDVNGGYSRDTECQDIVHGPQVQTFLALDLPSAIDARFRTIASPRYRAIGGLSTGGYCGLNLMLRHQDVFSAAIMHSGEVKPTESRYSGSLWDGNAALRRANTPSEYIPTMRFRRRVAVYCDAGVEDRESVDACHIAQQLLRARGVPVTVNIVDHEGHTFKAWRFNLYFSLPWLSRWFEAQGLPTRARTVEVRRRVTQSSSLRSTSVAQISNSPLR